MPRQVRIRRKNEDKIAKVIQEAYDKGYDTARQDLNSLERVLDPRGRSIEGFNVKYSIQRNFAGDDIFALHCEVRVPHLQEQSDKYFHVTRQIDSSVFLGDYVASLNRHITRMLIREFCIMIGAMSGVCPAYIMVSKLSDFFYLFINKDLLQQEFGGEPILEDRTAFLEYAYQELGLDFADYKCLHFADKSTSGEI